MIVVYHDYRVRGSIMTAVNHDHCHGHDKVYQSSCAL